MTRGAAQTRSVVVVATFDDPTAIHVDSQNDLYVRGQKITRAGGWLRVGADDDRIPRVLRWIAVRLRVRIDDGRTVAVYIDRIRFGDVEWDRAEQFHAQFDGVWGPHLVEQTRRALRPRSSGED